MGKPIKPRKKHRCVKTGEITASTGMPRRTVTVKANPQADQTNWRVKMQAGRIKFDDAAKEIFLQEFAKHGRKKDSATVAGVSVITVTLHCKNDPEFAIAFDEAQAEYRDKFVAKTISDLAYNGILVERFKDGEVVETKRDYPIRLIELELKRIDSTYRDKQEVSLTGGGGVLVVPAAMTPAEWVKDQERKNKERTNPTETPATAPTEAPVAPKAAEVVLPNRAEEVAARNAAKAVKAVIR